MAEMSNSVRRTGKKFCELCGKRGSNANPLSRHHIDGNARNNERSNHMVVHRILCHTLADFITQMFIARGTVPTGKRIYSAWELLMLNDWLMKLLTRGEA